ncbi:MAG: O-methyltransferase [Gemmatimonas sp.]
MKQELWSKVDDYLAALLVRQDADLAAASAHSEQAGLPAISVSPPLGKLLHLLVRMSAARNILEIGTLAGYSTIWLARALEPGGRVVTLEIDSTHADVARENFRRAGVEGAIDIRVGRAIDTLPALAGSEPFDFIFIDADKESLPEYFSWSLKLSRPGTTIVVDNVIREGAVVDAHSTDPRVQGVRRFNAMVAAEPRVSATAVQTVGSKGYDGFALVLVVE